VIILDKIENKLNELWASVIDFYEFNILNHTITFNVTVIENGKEAKYNIKFKGVSSYHFYEDNGEQRINPVEPDDGDYLELTSIQFYKNGIGNITTKSQVEQWAEQYYSNANFALEIWNSMLFIEASNVILDDVEYEVKYPNN
jgi:hypothetical protein